VLRRETPIDRAVEEQIAAELPRLTENLWGAQPRRLRFRHLSGWKNTGAFRVTFDLSSGGRRSLIWKMARYDPEEIPALHGLPLRPGPAEYAIYSRFPRLLEKLLPQVHQATASDRGLLYTYVLEDLTQGYATLDVQRHAIAAVAALPRVHEALRAVGSAAGENPELLRFDRSFSARVVDYAAGSFRSEGLDASRDLQLVVRSFDAVARAYATRIDGVYDRHDVTLIHGDLNPSNIMVGKSRETSLKLIDWEWCGHGLILSDLASLLKSAPPEVETAALEAYRKAVGKTPVSFPDEDYHWAKLQRALLDAAFFIRQRQAAPLTTRTFLDRAIERACGRVRDCLDALGESIFLPRGGECRPTPRG
jgi:hypothetical protein